MTAVVLLLACTGFYVGRDASSNGAMLLGRTVDIPPYTACFRVVARPGNAEAGGGYVCTPAVSAVGLGEFASAGVNRRGVAVTGTVTGYTAPEARASDPFVKSGCAEKWTPGWLMARATSARNAVELLGRLIAEKGNKQPNVYMFADADEAWYVETYTGHEWAAVRMPQDKVAVWGNEFMIGEFDPSSPDSMSSPGIASMPEKAGFAVKGALGLIDLFATYGRRRRDDAHFRTWWGSREWAKTPAGPYSLQTECPLFFEPRKKVSTADVFELMRARYEGTEWNPEETGRRDWRVIATEKQATCHVIEVRRGLPAPLACTLWACLANAEHSVFLPITSLARRTHEDYERDWDAPKTDWNWNPGLAGAHFRRLCALAEVDRKMYGRGVRAFWRPMEADSLSEWPSVLAQAAERLAVSTGDAESFMTADAIAREGSALSAAKAVFDELCWYICQNNISMRFKPEQDTFTLKPIPPQREFVPSFRPPTCAAAITP